MIAKGSQTQIIYKKIRHTSCSHLFEDKFKQATNSINDIFEKVQYERRDS